MADLNKKQTQVVDQAQHKASEKELAKHKKKMAQYVKCLSERALVGQIKSPRAKEQPQWYRQLLADEVKERQAKASGKPAQAPVAPVSEAEVQGEDKEA